MKKSPLVSIFFIVLIDILGYTIILPLLPFYAESFGATPIVVGWLLSSYGICQFIAGPILGQISDRVGRKPVLLASQVGTLIGFLILAFSKSMTLVFVARAIDGFTAGNISVAQAYISDVTEPAKRAKSFGLIGIAFGFGFIVGPAIAGSLVRFGHQAPIFAATGLSAASILATFILLPAAKTHAPGEATAPDECAGRGIHFKNYLQLFTDPHLGGLLWQFFFFIFAFVMFFSGFALFAERRYTLQALPFGIREVSWVFAYVGFLGIIIQGGLIGRFVKLFGEPRLVLAGFILMATGFLYLGKAFHIPNLIAAVTIIFCGMSLLRPSLTSLITQKAGRNRQGMALGITQSLMSFCQISAPFLTGLLIQHLWLSGWAWIGAFSAGCGLLVLRFSKRLTTASESNERID